MSSSHNRRWIIAAAIPAAIGVGSSLIGGISGKGAQKKQQKLAEQQLRQLQPLINAQIAASQFGLDQARSIVPGAADSLRSVYDKSTGQFDPLMGAGKGLLASSLPYLQGASTALNDLQKFYRPFMFDGQRAIDRFLPSAQRTNELLAPEFGNINQGFRSAQDNIAKFAPRGGGRVSSMARADIDRQKGLSDVFFTGRQSLADKSLGAAFQGAQGQQGVAQLLQSLGFGKGQLGLSTMGQGLQALGLGGQSASNLGQLGSSMLGQGLSGGQQASSLYNQQANRAYGGGPQQSGSGKDLGGYLVDLFSDKGVQNKVGDLFGGLFGSIKSNIIPGTDFNYRY